MHPWRHFAGLSFLILLGCHLGRTFHCFLLSGFCGNFKTKKGYQVGGFQVSSIPPKPLMEVQDLFSTKVLFSHSGRQTSGMSMPYTSLRISLTPQTNSTRGFFPCLELELCFDNLILFWETHPKPCTFIQTVSIHVYTNMHIQFVQIKWRCVFPWYFQQLLLLFITPQTIFLCIVHHFTLQNTVPCVFSFHSLQFPCPTIFPSAAVSIMVLYFFLGFCDHSQLDTLFLIHLIILHQDDASSPTLT